MDFWKEGTPTKEQLPFEWKFGVLILLQTFETIAASFGMCCTLSTLFCLVISPCPLGRLPPAMKVHVFWSFWVLLALEAQSPVAKAIAQALLLQHLCLFQKA